MAVILIGITLSQIYDLGLALGQEGENTQLLVDRMYYLRKDSEYVFWRAAAGGEEERLDGILNWANATEMGQDAIQKASWIGGKHSAAQVFQGRLTPPGCFGTYCNKTITKGVTDNIKYDIRRCIHLSGGKTRSGGETRALGTSFHLEHPKTASLFMVAEGDYTCPT